MTSASPFAGPGQPATLEPIAPPRSTWQRLYQLAHRTRRRWYSRHALRLPRPVVSVGNLHWGGTGKTPLVAAIAAHLRDSGHGVTILSRGYRSRGRGIRVVSAGDGPLLGPLVAGDEPVLLAGELPGVSVVVGPDRYEAGLHALERMVPAPDLLLLDDGFSHLRLYRDLDLLVFPAADLLGGGRLFPSGRLREPLASAAHADAALVTGGTPPEAMALRTALQDFGFQGPSFASPNATLPARTPTGETIPQNSRVFLVAAIARPEVFSYRVGELDFDVVGERMFPDHYSYPDAGLMEIRRAAQESGADFVLTTAKDAVKLLGRLETPWAELPLRTVPEETFWTWLDQRLAGLIPRTATQ